MKADGAICVKTFFERGFGGVRDLPVPRIETIRELVKSAHAAGLPVLMHANSDEAQRFALDAGVDIVAHGLWNWTEPHSTTKQLPPGITKILDDEVARNVAVQPTMQVLHGLQDLFSEPYLADPRMARVLPPALIDWYRSPEGQWFHLALAQDVTASGFDSVIDRGKQTAAYLIARHARILFGSDTPSAPTFANPPGLNEWLEMRRLVEAGETPQQIFKSATLANAQALKLDRDIGTVAVGKRANLLLLRQDPTQTVDAYTDIAKVILNGRVFSLSELEAAAAH
jgi:imidazolonepropionase-like amidohydrolase